MKLQIKKLFLLRRGTRELKSYGFETGMLNVIIGQGARGKTTIWSVIDYVCCAKDSDIDSNISKAVQWVGLVLDTSLGPYAIARELNDGLDSKTPNFFLKHLEAGVYDIDVLEISANSNLTSIKGVLDRITGVEVMTSLADENGQKISFSIRHLLNIVGQDYRTVADQQHLFAFKAPQQWQAIAKYFATVMGIDADSLNILRAEKQNDEKDLRRFKEEYRRALSLSEQWKGDLISQLLEAKRLTMIPVSTEIPKEIDKCVSLVRTIIEEAAERPTHSYNVELLGDLAERISKNQERKAGLEFEIGQIQIRIQELEELEKKATAIHNEAAKAKDRMEIARWMKENWYEYQPGLFRYPYSDGRIADEVREEISRLNAALERYEKTSLATDKMMQFRNLNAAEKKRLKDKQIKLAEEVASLREEISALKNRGDSERKKIEQYESVNEQALKLLGKFSKAIELVEGLSDTGALVRQIEVLKAKVLADEDRINLERSRVDASLHDVLLLLSLRSMEIAQGVGLDESFRFANIKFDIDKLDFKILYGDSETYLKSRKSTANHVAFHIGLTAALQEVCSGRENALLPDFVLYDQPSQGRGGVADGKNIGEDCFVNIVKVLAESVAKAKEPWQPILIDSWNKDTLKKVADVRFHLVADLDETSGLVPLDWMNL